MAKTNSIQKKHAKWKSFLFFLVLATFFWVLTKFTKEYAAPVTSEIEYINLPPSRFLASENVSELSFNLYTSGFDFLNYKLKKPILKIDVAKYFNKDRQNVILNSKQIAKEINLQFPSVNAVTAISIDSLLISLNPVVTKKVPVIVPKTITYKSGFKPTSDFKITPDSVHISGPSQQIAKVDSVLTNGVTLNAISEDVATQTSIIPPDIENIKMDQLQVSLSVAVKEFTQQQYEYELIVTNVPADVSLKLIPQRVVITFEIPVEVYSEVKKEDFEVVCDFSKRNEEDNFMLPELTRQHPSATQIEFETKKIDFLVFKQ